MEFNQRVYLIGFLNFQTKANKKPFWPWTPLNRMRPGRTAHSLDRARLIYAIHRTSGTPRYPKENPQRRHSAAPVSG